MRITDDQPWKGFYKVTCYFHPRCGFHGKLKDKPALLSLKEWLLSVEPRADAHSAAEARDLARRHMDLACERFGATKLT